MLGFGYRGIELLGFISKEFVSVTNKITLFVTVYPEVPPPTYSSLVFNKESPLKHNSQDVKPKVFMIAI
jgi:hypothetical protein